MPILHFENFKRIQFIGCKSPEIYVELTDSIENVIHKIKENMPNLITHYKKLLVRIEDETGHSLEHHKTIADCNVIGQSNILLVFDGSMWCEKYELKFVA